MTDPILLNKAMETVEKIRVQCKLHGLTPDMISYRIVEFPELLEVMKQNTRVFVHVHSPSLNSLKQILMEVLSVFEIVPNNQAIEKMKGDYLIFYCA